MLDIAVPNRILHARLSYSVLSRSNRFYTKPSFSTRHSSSARNIRDYWRSSSECRYLSWNTILLKNMNRFFERQRICSGHEWYRFQDCMHRYVCVKRKKLYIYKVLSSNICWVSHISYIYLNSIIRTFAKFPRFFPKTFQWAIF